MKTFKSPVKKCQECFLRRRNKKGDKISVCYTYKCGHPEAPRDLKVDVDPWACVPIPNRCPLMNAEILLCIE